MRSPGHESGMYSLQRADLLVTMLDNTARVCELQNKELYAVLSELRDEPHMSENKVHRARFNIYGPRNKPDKSDDKAAAAPTQPGGKRNRQNVPKVPRASGLQKLQRQCDVKVSLPPAGPSTPHI